MATTLETVEFNILELGGFTADKEGISALIGNMSERSDIVKADIGSSCCCQGHLDKEKLQDRRKEK